MLGALLPKLFDRVLVVSFALFWFVVVLVAFVVVDVILLLEWLLYMSLRAMLSYVMAFFGGWVNPAFSGGCRVRWNRICWRGTCQMVGGRVDGLVWLVCRCQM